MSFTVLLDANVLYPAYLRDALLRLAEAGVYQVRWTDQILQEMARNAKKKVPEARHDRIDQNSREDESGVPRGEGYRLRRPD